MATQSRIGWRPYVTQVVNAVDADATAFIAAAGITNLTQAAAINTLVNDLKTYGLWTKMKALYPFVGGSATSHKFNLKDPRDLNAAYRLVFNGGWVHSSTGAKPNGTTAYANTLLAPNVMGQHSIHTSFYSRTNVSGLYVDIGGGSVSDSWVEVITWYNARDYLYMNTLQNEGAVSSSSIGFYVGNRTNTGQSLFKDNTKLITGNKQSLTPSTYSIYLSAENSSNTTAYFSPREQAFASIGDGLTDTEAANFYNSVQKFQTTLGRQIGSPIVSDTDAQAFLNAAAITDLGQANAVNTLVVDLKAAGVWTKMKALYPFVGGTATTHKWNLKDPRDLDAAFRLVFNGGWTHSATGAQPNGTTGYADTKLNENTTMTLGNQHISFYSRTNTVGLYVDMGLWDTVTGGAQILSRIVYPASDSFMGYVDDTNHSYVANATSWGFYMANRTSISQLKLQINSAITTFANNASSKVNRTYWIGARNINSTSYLFTPREFAFATIGDGLTDTEASAFYTAVQKYQTSLSRQIGTPVLAEGQTAGLLETYTGSSAAYSLRKLRTGYYGAAIRVRRSSDNTEQDIAFKTNGTLDTVGLTGFVGSGNGFVTTWYDQSGNGKHAYQISASNQPRIVLGGVIDLINNKPSLKFTNGQMLVTTQNVLSTGNQPYSIYGVSYNNATADSTLFFLGADNLNVSNQYLSLQVNTNGGMTNFRHFWGTGFGWSPGLNTNNIQQYYYIGYDGSTKYSSTNNTNLTNTQVVSMNLQSPILKIGQLPQVSEYYKGYHQELILFNSNSSSTTTGIKSNINSYYTIY